MNPEYRRILLMTLGIGCAGAGVAAFFSPQAAVALVLAVTVLAVFFFTELHNRNKRIDRLCGKLDALLYEEERWDFSAYEEGEISILQDKIGKLTVRLREQADQLQSEKHLQERMMTDISHQLKTPLTSMQLILSGLQKEDLSGEERKKRIFELLGLLDRIDDLVGLLLKMAKLESGTVLMKQEQVHVPELLERVRAPLEVLLELHGIDCRIEGEEDVSYTGDADWSAEALENILKNAVEHTPDGGCIRISCQETALFSEICIEDSGTGVPLEELPCLFERFYRGKEARHSGFGIGLSFARTVIVQQNGTIRAENRQEGGLRFVIRFYKGDNSVI